MRREYWNSRREAIDQVAGMYDFKPQDLATWRILQKNVLNAKELLSDFEESTMGQQLDPAERERLIVKHVRDHTSVTHGDGMCEDAAEAELREMSDLEFWFVINDTFDEE